MVEGPWDLISHFCKAHHMPLSTKHLIYLAECNDWVRFLYEAQEQGFKPDEVHSVIKDNFKDANLRDHLCIVISNMMDPPPKRDRPLTREEYVSIV